MPAEQFSPTSPSASWEGAFTPSELDRIEAIGDALTLAKATLVGGADEGAYEHIRITRTAWIMPSPDTKWIYDRMQAAVRTLNDRIWQFDIRGFSENFQYTVYHGDEGGHYDWHVDQGDMAASRKLSLSLQLSDPSEYEGCELQFHGARSIDTAPKARGALIAFPAYVLHRVTPITSGTRKAVVVWTTGPNSDEPLAMSEDVRDAPAGFLVARQDVFTQAELDAITALGDRLTPVRAEIAGRKDNTDHLRVTRVAWIDAGPQTDWLFARIEQAVLDLNARFFKYELYGLAESFQYTVYESSEGGHYDWHCDTGKTKEPRKISLTLQLSEPDAYEGGDLMLEAGEGACVAQKGRGTLVAFPSYLLHRVTPVIRGTRKSLVVWVAGPQFR